MNRRTRWVKGIVHNMCMCVCVCVIIILLISIYSRRTKTIYNIKREQTREPCAKNTVGGGAARWPTGGRMRRDVRIIIKMNWTRKLIDETRAPERAFSAEEKPGCYMYIYVERNEERWHAQEQQQQRRGGGWWVKWWGKGIGCN